MATQFAASAAFVCPVNPVKTYTDVILNPSSGAAEVFVYNMSLRYEKEAVPRGLIFQVNLTDPDPSLAKICYEVTGDGSAGTRRGWTSFPYDPQATGCQDYWYIYCPHAQAAAGNNDFRQACLNGTGLPQGVIAQNIQRCQPPSNALSPLSYPTFLPSHNELYFCNNPPRDFVPLCWPLMLILGLLLGASYALGRNPLGAFDFSAPRMGRGRIYTPRVQQKSFDMFGYVMGANSAVGSAGKFADLAEGKNVVSLNDLLPEFARSKDKSKADAKDREGNRNWSLFAPVEKAGLAVGKFLFGWLVSDAVLKKIADAVAESQGKSGAQVVENAKGEYEIVVGELVRDSKGRVDLSKIKESQKIGKIEKTAYGRVAGGMVFDDLGQRKVEHAAGNMQYATTGMTGPGLGINAAVTAPDSGSIGAPSFRSEKYASQITSQKTYGDQVSAGISMLSKHIGDKLGISNFRVDLSGPGEALLTLLRIFTAVRQLNIASRAFKPFRAKGAFSGISNLGGFGNKTAFKFMGRDFSVFEVSMWIMDPNSLPYPFSSLLAPVLSSAKEAAETSLRGVDIVSQAEFSGDGQYMRQLQNGNLLYYEKGKEGEYARVDDSSRFQAINDSFAQGSKHGFASMKLGEDGVLRATSISAGRYQAALERQNEYFTALLSQVQRQMAAIEPDIGKGMTAEHAEELRNLRSLAGVDDVSAYLSRYIGLLEGKETLSNADMMFIERLKANGMLDEKLSADNSNDRQKIIAKLQSFRDLNDAFGGDNRNEYHALSSMAEGLARMVQANSRILGIMDLKAISQKDYDAIQKNAELTDDQKERKLKNTVTEGQRAEAVRLEQERKDVSSLAANQAMATFGHLQETGSGGPFEAGMDFARALERDRAAQERARLEGKPAPKSEAAAIEIGMKNDIADAEEEVRKLARKKNSASYVLAVDKLEQLRASEAICSAIKKSFGKQGENDALKTALEANKDTIELGLHTMTRHMLANTDMLNLSSAAAAGASQAGLSPKATENLLHLVREEVDRAFPLAGIDLQDVENAKAHVQRTIEQTANAENALSNPNSQFGILGSLVSSMNDQKTGFSLAELEAKAKLDEHGQAAVAAFRKAYTDTINFIAHGNLEAASLQAAWLGTAVSNFGGYLQEGKDMGEAWKNAGKAISEKYSKNEGYVDPAKAQFVPGTANQVAGMEATVSISQEGININGKEFAPVEKSGITRDASISLVGNRLNVGGKHFELAEGDRVEINGIVVEINGVQADTLYKPVTAKGESLVIEDHAITIGGKQIAYGRQTVDIGGEERVIVPYAHEFTLEGSEAVIGKQRVELADGQKLVVHEGVAKIIGADGIPKPNEEYKVENGELEVDGKKFLVATSFQDLMRSDHDFAQALLNLQMLRDAQQRMERRAEEEMYEGCGYSKATIKEIADRNERTIAAYSQAVENAASMMSDPKTSEQGAKVFKSIAGSLSTAAQTADLERTMYENSGSYVDNQLYRSREQWEGAPAFLGSRRMDLYYQIVNNPNTPVLPEERAAGDAIDLNFVVSQAALRFSEGKLSEENFGKVVEFAQKGNHADALRILNPKYLGEFEETGKEPVTRKKQYGSVVQEGEIEQKPEPQGERREEHEKGAPEFAEDIKRRKDSKKRKESE